MPKIVRKPSTKMLRAIDDYKITGIETTLSFCKFVLKHEAFVSGQFDTKFVERYFTPEKLQESFNEEDLEILAAAGVFLLETTKPKNQSNHTIENRSSTNWKKRLKNG